MGLILVPRTVAGSARTLAVSALACLCIASATAPALADESSAEQLFQEGLAAMNKNDYAVACEAFTQSNRADPSPGTQINLALCFEKQKKWASAWAWYRSAVGLAQQRGQKDREKLAEDSANRLKPQIHHVVVTLASPPPDAVVKRDGDEVTIAIAGKEVPLPTDPGEHKFEVTARGKKPWSKIVTIADNAQTDRIEVSKLDDAPVDVTAGGAAGRPGGDHAGEPRDGSGQRTVGIIVGAAGILAGVAAGGLFIAAKGQADNRDKWRTAEATAPDPTTKAQDEHSASTYNSAANSDQLVALALGGGAIVLVGVGIYLFVSAPKGAEKPTAGLQVSPYVSPTFAGLGLHGAF